LDKVRLKQIKNCQYNIATQIKFLNNKGRQTKIKKNKLVKNRKMGIITNFRIAKVNTSYLMVTTTHTHKIEIFYMKEFKLSNRIPKELTKSLI